MNVVQLRAGSYMGGMAGGVKTRLLPRALREGTSPWLALPIGLLFGFGFETSSQIAAYVVAFGADVGIAGALIVGATFCFGMVCTDTMDSVVVHRLVAFRSNALPAIMRVWVLSVTALALIVAAYELAQVLGWKPPFSDLALSGTLVGGAGAGVRLRLRAHAPHRRGRAGARADAQRDALSAAGAAPRSLQARQPGARVVGEAGLEVWVEPERVGVVVAWRARASPSCSAITPAWYQMRGSAVFQAVALRAAARAASHLPARAAVQASVSSANTSSRTARSRRAIA